MEGQEKERTRESKRIFTRKSKRIRVLLKIESRMQGKIRQRKEQEKWGKENKELSCSRAEVQVINKYTLKH